LDSDRVAVAVTTFERASRLLESSNGLPVSGVAAGGPWFWGR
jgi:hypothetical protein